MALVSELSMNQAAAMKLQQEVKSKEQELEQCYVRMERGEAPNEEAEREWLRMIRDEARREKELMERKEVPLFCVQVIFVWSTVSVPFCVYFLFLL